jgi:hypothetical protein
LPLAGGDKSPQLKVEAHVEAWPVNSQGKQLAQFLSESLVEGTEVEYYFQTSEGERRLTKSVTNEGDPAFVGLMQLFSKLCDIAEIFNLEFKLPDVISPDEANKILGIFSFLESIPQEISGAELQIALTEEAVNEYRNDWDQAASPRPSRVVIGPETVELLGVAFTLPTRVVLIENVEPAFTLDFVKQHPYVDGTEFEFRLVEPHTMTHFFEPASHDLEGDGAPDGEAPPSA